MKHLFFIVFCLCTAYILPAAVFATTYDSSHFSVLDPVINNAAGRQTSLTYIELQSVGQNAIGISDSSHFILKSGFLYFANPAAGGSTGGTTGSGGGGQGNVPLFILPFFGKPIPVPPIPQKEIDHIISNLPCKEGHKRQDLNCDGVVGIIDFSIFLYLSDHPRPDNPADFNNDKTIDVLDLSILFSAWDEKLLTFDSASSHGNQFAVADTPPPTKTYFGSKLASTLESVRKKFFGASPKPLTFYASNEQLKSPELASSGSWFNTHILQRVKTVLSSFVSRSKNLLANTFTGFFHSLMNIH